jgi:curved DNA-binding protein CbpA
VNGRDYYQVLDIERSADTRIIKEAYRKLAFQFHPDRNAGDHATVERMQGINEAYAVLSDPEKRRRYDLLSEQYGSGGYDRFRQSYSDQDIFRGSDINQIFQEMARTFGFRSFDEIFRESSGQGYRTFSVHRPGFFGRFVVFGPARGAAGDQKAVAPGTTWPQRLLGGLTGYFVGKVLSKAAGTAARDRHGPIVLDAREARDGARVQYLDEKTRRVVSISVPAGIRHGQKIRLRGMGKRGWRGDQPGDLYLEVRIRKPLLERIRGLILRLAEPRGGKPAKTSGPAAG